MNTSVQFMYNGYSGIFEKEKVRDIRAGGDGDVTGGVFVCRAGSAIMVR